MRLKQISEGIYELTDDAQFRYITSLGKYCDVWEANGERVLSIDLDTVYIQELP